jgi:hypothetical protein
MIHAFEMIFYRKEKDGYTLSSNNCAHRRGYLDRCLRARVNVHTAVANCWVTYCCIGNSHLACCVAKLIGNLRNDGRACKPTSNR